MTEDSREGLRSEDPNESLVSVSRSRSKATFAWPWTITLRLLWNRYFIFILFMVGLSEILSRISGLSGIRSHLFLEVPLLLVLYWALNFVLRPGKLSPYIAALPMVLIYTGYDVFFVGYGDVFRIVDLRNVPELMKVLPLAWKLGLGAILGLPPLLVLCFIHYRKYWRLLGIAGLAAAAAVAVEFFPGKVISGLERAGLQAVEHSDAQCVNDNGRFTMSVYSEARRRRALAETALYRNRGDYPAQALAAADFVRARGNRRNIHLVVLESFVDPTLFAAVKFSKDPRHPDFVKLVGDRQGFSISPVFGGRTAQAEFEVLCGVPSLHRLSAIEFNDFTGDAAGCMPGILAQAGYSTIVSNSFEPDYFNSTKAYTGIGFQNIYYPAEYTSARETYFGLGSGSEEFMFDGDLFDQNLQFVARKLREEPDKPMVNYLLGVYGHEPHGLDPSKRPMVLSMKAAHEDDQLLRAANQYYYRTEAIARFIRGLIRIDPHSLIIIVSDHLPPLNEGTKSYKDFRYLDNIQDSIHLNRLLIVENGTVVRHKTIHHHDIPSLIYNYLTHEEFCAKLNCALSDAAREEKYLSLMARAVGVR